MSSLLQYIDDTRKYKQVENLEMSGKIFILEMIGKIVHNMSCVHIVVCVATFARLLIFLS